MVAAAPLPDDAVAVTVTSDAERRRAVVELARADSACFAQFVLKNEKDGSAITVADHQSQWHDLLSANDRLLIFSAIETGKTQHISIARVLWEIGHNPNIRIVILSAVREGAKKIARTLRKYIESSEELHEVFPDLKPGAIWNELQFSVKRTTFSKDPTVQCIGVNGKIYGSRTDLLIIDDVLDPENTATPELRAKVIRWVKAMPMSRLGADARMWVVGTAFHREDFLHHLAGLPRFAGRAFRYPIVVRREDGTLESRWPSQWPLRRIELFREEQGELEFARQLMCEARSDDDARFKQEWIDWAKAAGEGKRVEHMLEYVPIGYSVYIGVDLGVQQHRKADPTSLAAVALHPDLRREILAIESGRWTGPDIINRIKDFRARYKGILVIENNAAQDFIRQFAAVEGLDSIPVTTGKQKLHPLMGIEGIAVELQRRQWIIPNVGGVCHPEIQKFIGEMLWFDPARHTGDRLMSVWLAREGMRIGIKPKPTVETGHMNLIAR